MSGRGGSGSRLSPLSLSLSLSRPWVRVRGEGGGGWVAPAEEWSGVEAGRGWGEDGGGRRRRRRPEAGPVDEHPCGGGGDGGVRNPSAREGLGTGANRRSVFLLDGRSGGAVFPAGWFFLLQCVCGVEGVVEDGTKKNQ